MDCTHWAQGYVLSHLIFRLRHCSQDKAGLRRFLGGAVGAVELGGSDMSDLVGLTPECLLSLVLPRVHVPGSIRIARLVGILYGRGIHR